MEPGVDDVVTHGLDWYVRHVAEALGPAQECWSVHTDSPATAYVGLKGRLPGLPDRDVALIWDERLGWSIVVETHSGEDLIVVEHFDAEPRPAPWKVARWARSAVCGKQVARRSRVER